MFHNNPALFLRFCRIKLSSVPPFDIILSGCGRCINRWTGFPVLKTALLTPLHFLTYPKEEKQTTSSSHSNVFYCFKNFASSFICFLPITILYRYATNYSTWHFCQNTKGRKPLYLNISYLASSLTTTGIDPDLLNFIAGNSGFPAFDKGNQQSCTICCVDI